VTNKPLITIIVLAGLTLCSFALISSYVSMPTKGPSAPQAATSPSVKAGVFPSFATTPGLSARSTAVDKDLYHDLSRALALLDEMRKAVLAADWSAAQSFFGEFQQRTQRLPTPQLNQPDFSPVMQDFFTLYRVELARALHEQNDSNARFCLNQLYAILSEQHARLGTHGLPLELGRLNFLVREVELWAALHNETLLAERRQALRETWQEVRPVIAVRRGGREITARFDTLLEQMSAAPTPAVAALVAPCQQELAHMDNLFRRPPARPANPATSPPKAAVDE
jgi:hypothetical protein